MNWRYHNPVSVHFGVGVLQQLPQSVSGDVALLIYPQASAGLRQQIRSLLGAQLVQVIDDIPSNPTLQWCRAHHAMLHQGSRPLTGLIAIGGGSVIDAAKTISVKTASNRFNEVEEHLLKGGKDGILGSLPIVALPTTAGTGSEVTPWATVWDFQADQGRGAKYSLHLETTWCQSALIDPELSLGVPHDLLRNSALDALSHALEAIWNVNANPISDQFALAAAKGVIAHLEAALKDPSNLNERSAISRSALLAGMAFSNTKTALAHSISYPMTLNYGLPHGLACSFTLPMVWRMAEGRDSKRDRLLGAVFDCDVQSGASRLEAFLERVGVSTSFADYGVDDASVARIISDALDGVRGKNFIGRPNPEDSGAVEANTMRHCQVAA
jgi:phosphonate metabolism-associated iron-containing alcohol dehydrogenase